MAEHHSQPIQLSRRQAAEADVDMTPMVDVTFLLLIFFMVTASLSLQKSFEAPPKEDESTQAVSTRQLEQDQETTLIRIDLYNTFWTPTPDGGLTELTNAQDLIVALRSYRNQVTPPPSRAIVIAHGDAEHGRVIMALDAAAEVGYDEISWSVDDNAAMIR